MSKTEVQTVVEVVGPALNDIYHNAKDIFSKNPIAAIAFIKKVKNLPSTVRDAIFLECFETYILEFNEYDYTRKQFMKNNLQKMSEALADVSPNPVAHYEGNPKQLHEYSKRILKLIDECGTIQKAVYLANISRAFVNRQIDKRLFFKFGQCIRILTEEDLIYLKDNIKEGVI